eukprot:CAMPEP_0202700174 /NCGR_PEP_ID=MMETSP1385-20130828/13382_1 /ASSEMBLY_ACC=CAM_ASM_000861 /TAXON_ID=933848 /ORGANISM="Elphidium margaritaceum" /LENGTH=57 /DNA_ID=CAMNT_0049357305 /DNA_START=468 /DNA_END=638 /DNA_ORIENTATION=-
MKNFIRKEQLENPNESESSDLLDVLIRYNLVFGVAIFTNELFYVSLIVNKYTEWHGW